MNDNSLYRFYFVCENDYLAISTFQPQADRNVIFEQKEF